MVLGVIRRSFGRIFVRMSREEAYSIAKEIVSELKFDIKEETPSKYYFEGKTKLSWTKNKFAEKFFILIKDANGQSVIDIYYSGYGVTGPDSKVIIGPFHKKLMEKTRMNLDLQISLIDIEEDDILKTADEIVHLDTPYDPNSPASIENMDDSLSANSIQALVQHSPNNSMSSDKIMSVEQMKHEIALKHDQFKAQWDKNGIIQFKNQHIAILQRAFGAQVQFIIAYDQLTREGYRLMAIDEGKTGGQASGGLTGGVNSYYYFQKIDYVR